VWNTCNLIVTMDKNRDLQKSMHYDILEFSTHTRKTSQKSTCFVKGTIKRRHCAWSSKRSNSMVTKQGSKTKWPTENPENCKHHNIMSKTEYWYSHFKVTDLTFAPITTYCPVNQTNQQMQNLTVNLILLVEPCQLHNTHLVTQASS